MRRCKLGLVGIVLAALVAAAAGYGTATLVGSQGAWRPPLTRGFGEVCGVTAQAGGPHFIVGVKDRALLRYCPAGTPEVTHTFSLVSRTGKTYSAYAFPSGGRDLNQGWAAVLPAGTYAVAGAEAAPMVRNRSSSSRGRYFSVSSPGSVAIGRKPEVRPWCVGDLVMNAARQGQHPSPIDWLTAEQHCMSRYSRPLERRRREQEALLADPREAQRRLLAAVADGGDDALPPAGVHDLVAGLEAERLGSGRPHRRGRRAAPPPPGPLRAGQLP